MQAIISAQNLSKSFGDFKAVSQLSFSIRPGSVYGFLGQNGAGKSTTMRMLLGLVRPDSGSVFIKGQEFKRENRQLLQHIGAVIERPDMYGYLSGWHNLRMMADLSRKKIPDRRLFEVLELTGLKGREKDKVKAYSQGMKQRLGIAIALVHNPEVLVLDEPTNGLDPQGISEMRNLILHLSREQGKTVLISSHLLYEIEQVATEMLIIHKGKKIIEGSVRTLLDPKETLFEIRLTDPEAIRVALENSRWDPCFVKQEEKNLVFKMHPGQMPELNRWLVEQDAAVLEIRSGHSLEAYFLSLTHDAAYSSGTF